MALLQKGTIFAVDVESTIGAGQSGAWANGDVVGFNEDSSMTPATESIERSVMNGSFFNCPSLAGKETVSGSLNAELGIQTVTGTEKGKLKSHLLFLAGLGSYVEAGADVDVVGKSIAIGADPVTTPEDYDLYKISKPTDARTTLCIREIIGGNGNTVLDYKGIVVDSIGLNLTSGSIITATFSVSGTGYNTATGQTVLANLGCGANPFVVKSAKLSINGAELDASDVSITITNTNTDRMAISSTGISDKITTARAIEVSYKIDMTDTTPYAKLKNNDVGAMFLELTNGVEKIYIYLPKINWKSVDKANDSSVVTLSLKSSAYPDTAGEAIYIATKKA